MRELRKARGWRMEDLADQAGIQRNQVWRVETGQHNPELDTLGKVANGLGVPLAELFEERETQA